MEDRELQSAVHKALLRVGLKNHSGFVSDLSRRIMRAPRDEASIRKAIGDALRSYPVAARRGLSTSTLVDMILAAANPILPYLDAASNFRVSIDDIDSFAAVRKIRNNDVRDNVPVRASEDAIQSALEVFVRELSHKTDWGGEYSDLLTTHLVYLGVRRLAVATLKGPVRRYPLQIRDYGVNADQIERLFQVSADIYLIQGCGPFADTLVSHVSGLAQRRAAQGHWLRYCLIDGTDTARVLAAAQRPS